MIASHNRQYSKPAPLTLLPGAERLIAGEVVCGSRFHKQLAWCKWPKEGSDFCKRVRGICKVKKTATIHTLVHLQFEVINQGLCMCQNCFFFVDNYLLNINWSLWKSSETLMTYFIQDKTTKKTLLTCRSRIWINCLFPSGSCCTYHTDS